MSGVFERSWKITKLTFNVINKDRELIVFPLLSFIFSVLFLISLLFPTVITWYLEKSVSGNFEILSWVIIFLTYLGLAFIATFFNVCVVYTVKKRFEGSNASFGDSIGFALSKIHLIFYWSVISAVVGLLLRIIDQIGRRSKSTAGKMVASISSSLLGMAWGIITIFVVPGMVYENLGPIKAIKKSVFTLKKTWGESLVRSFGLGLINFLFIFVGVIIGAVLIYFSVIINSLALFVVIPLLLIYFLIVILVFGVATSVYNTALFVYADTGKIPEGYTPEIMHGAFKSKKK